MSIRHVIFDMGNVLMDYQPMRTLERRLQNQEELAEVYHALFSKSWKGLDLGTQTEDEVVFSACLQLPARLHEPVRWFMEHWPEDMPPMEESWKIVRELKERGFGLYLLSNAGLRFHEYAAGTPDFLLFDGIVISADEKVMKPDSRIYRILLSRYGLKAEECLFIDDLPRNVDGAAAVGIQGLRFAGAAELRCSLTELGLL